MSEGEDKARKFDVPMPLVALLFGLAGGGGLGSFASAKDTAAEVERSRKEILDSVGEVKVTVRAIEVRLENQDKRVDRLEKALDEIKVRLRTVETKRGGK